MKAEVITVGTELLMGYTLDTHSNFLSQECAVLGIPVHFHTSVDDDRDRLYQTFQLAKARSELVIVCGGLGPTLDDLTKETLAEFLGVELVQDPAAFEALQSAFAGRSIPMTDNNLKQTYVFPSGTVFLNSRGTAPGLAVTSEGITYILLPGPPGEMIPMFEGQIREFILSLIPSRRVIISHPLSFFGIGESLLEDKLKDLIQSETSPAIATYAEEAGVVLRITAKAESVNEAQEQIEWIRQEILHRVGEFCFSEKKEALEEVVLSIMRDRKQTVSMAESCTGGFLTYLLTTVPGSSQAVLGGVVTYTNEIKERMTKVSADTLQKYGAISGETATEMAEHTRDQFQSDFAISVTGLAGPTPSEGKPVGEVWIAIATKNSKTEVYRHMIRGQRKRIQLLAAKYALFHLWQRLKKG
ncbi:competence/damage-inducible protein A [Thermoactinomyces sp. DSM 45892]|uniref:competence/damage-inducible protein A n=1 Tax=Thermoactinomyces sp. DSM 45892 TaxID=1882753 RepID=UPI00089AFD76|nr:competence/damage-inducible protein A [Thermoactinomyces sp. DSM 45892]SDY49044.1 competence/damage-inducible protein cinA [Thermoactinomyces sp. DSM 45892]